MEIKTFDTILTSLCNWFDELIAPRRITRSNTNIIYLLLKAISKGFEVINNVCVVLSNKFDPASCSEEDLESVATLVGTERLLGSASGLAITVSNTGDRVSMALQRGLYSCALDEDTVFVFEVLEDKSIDQGSSVEYIAMSEKIGRFPVTAQEKIDVTWDGGVVPDGLTFSCSDNSNLLGEPEETLIEFRNRILSDTTRQFTIKELEDKLKRLPYLFDARILFNSSFTPLVEESYTIPPFYMAIFFEGSARNEIAEIVASSSVYPTLNVLGAVKTSFRSDVFVNGEYNVYIIPFTRCNYAASVTIKLDVVTLTLAEAREKIQTYLYNNFRGHVHKDYVKEEDFYSKLKESPIAGLEILNVDFVLGNEAVPYVSVPTSQIPYLTSVTVTEA